jgi:hypothetical protein
MKATSTPEKLVNWETVVSLKNVLFTFYAPNNLTKILLKYCARDLNHLVYNDLHGDVSSGIFNSIYCGRNSYIANVHLDWVILLVSDYRALGFY